MGGIKKKFFRFVLFMKFEENGPMDGICKRRAPIADLSRSRISFPGRPPRTMWFRCSKAAGWRGRGCWRIIDVTEKIPSIECSSVQNDDGSECKQMERANACKSGNLAHVQSLPLRNVTWITHLLPNYFVQQNTIFTTRLN